MTYQQQPQHASGYSSNAFGAPVARPPRPKVRLPPRLRIAFIHPDLGIGGAERLVVDAAVGLQKRGHHVEVFTSHHEDGPGGRSFEETRDGTLRVHVLGHLFPASLFSSLHIIFSILRQLHLTFLFLLASHLHTFSPLLLPFFSILIPLNTPYKGSGDWSWRRQLQPFDVIVVDQLSACVPLLRWLGGNRVVFYCHFPDQLLAPSTSSLDPSFGTSSPSSNSPHSNDDHEYYVPRWTPLSQLRKFYRMPIDLLEETTTGEADKILVNSYFTSGVFERTFRNLAMGSAVTVGRKPRVVHPGIEVGSYSKEEAEKKVKDEDRWLISEKPTLLSINRFESKKDVALAIDAFALAREQHTNLRLILAGGFDPRLQENVTSLDSLQLLAKSHKLSYYTYSASTLTSLDNLPPSLASSISTSSPPSSPTSTEGDHSIIFLLNMTSSQKALLLSCSPSVIALLYTPSYEHFGIVPLEAMASSLPVLATNTGGPTETIIDNMDLLKPNSSESLSTGLLRIPSPKVWAEAINDLFELTPVERTTIGARGLARVKELFSVDKLAEEMERACKDAAEIGEPIVFEVGFMKFVAFCVIALAVGFSGVVTWWYGLQRARALGLDV